MFRSWLHQLFARPTRTPRRLAVGKPCIEILEDRSCPSATLNLLANGVLQFNGGGVEDVVGVSYNPSTTTYTFRDLTEQITSPGGTGEFASISAQGVTSIEINASDVYNVFYVSSINQSLVYNGGAGSDILMLGPGGDDPNGVLNAPVSFHGGGGYDTLSVNDYPAPAMNHVYTMQGGSISRDNTLVATYDASAEFIRLNTSKGDEVVNVTGTTANAYTQITLQPVGVNSVIVGNAADTLDDMHGLLLVDTAAQPTSTNLVLNDSGSNAGHTYTLSTWGDQSAPATEFQRDGQDLVNAGTLLSLTLNTGAGNDAVNLWDNAPGLNTSINTGAGDDVVKVGDPYRGLDYVGGNITDDGGSHILGDELIVDDTHAAASQQYALQQFEIDRAGAAAIHNQNFQTLEIDTTQHGAFFNATSAPFNTLITVNMWNQSGDTLIGGNAHNDYYLTGANQGYLIALGSPVYFNGVSNIDGWLGKDTIHFSDAGSLSGNATGNTAGYETLDYSACTGDVKVNLATHTASKVGGSVLLFENVIGGQANNLLVGDGPPMIWSAATATTSSSAVTERTTSRAAPAMTS